MHCLHTEQSKYMNINIHCCHVDYIRQQTLLQQNLVDSNHNKVIILNVFDYKNCDNTFLNMEINLSNKAVYQREALSKECIYKYN